MKKLHEILAALEPIDGRDDLVIVRTKLTSPPISPSVLNVELAITPKDGIYTAAGLQEFMMNLVPLKPSYEEEFLIFPTHLWYGFLRFEEEVGGGSLVRTTIRVYPDPEFARRAIQGWGEKASTDSLGGNNLEQYLSKQNKQKESK